MKNATIFGDDLYVLDKTDKAIKQYTPHLDNYVHVETYDINHLDPIKELIVVDGDIVGITGYYKCELEISPKISERGYKMLQKAS